MYWFVSDAGEVIYVGKAKDLKARIAQYRQYKQLARSKQAMVTEAETVKFQALGSELEALLVEAQLIRQHLPKYNIRLRDDKSPLYIIITAETFPRVLAVRRNDVLRYKTQEVFGPYQSGYMLKQVLRLLRPIFRWCSVAGKRASQEESAATGRPCFYYHIERCSGACCGQITPQEYKHDIQRLIQFLRGNTKEVKSSLRQEIERLAKDERFEEANDRSLQWQMMEQLTNDQYALAPDLTLPSLYKEDDSRTVILSLAEFLQGRMILPPHWQPRRIEGYDVSNFQGQNATVAMVVFIDGQPAKDQYRIFHIRGRQTPDDYRMLQEAVLRRQKHPEWGVPNLILIDGGKGQLNAAQQMWRWGVPLISIAKRPDRIFVSTREGKLVGTPVEELGEAGKILQQVRDEAHRFSKRHAHIRLRKKEGIA